MSLNDRKTVVSVIVLCVLAIWGGLEYFLKVDSLSMALGFSIGLASFPILLRIYDYGFNGEHDDAFKAMGLSFFCKGAILFGSYMLLNEIIVLSFREYMFPLFFLIFFLGFVAIYLARRESDFSFLSN